MRTEDDIARIKQNLWTNWLDRQAFKRSRSRSMPTVALVGAACTVGLVALALHALSWITGTPHTQTDPWLGLAVAIAVIGICLSAMNAVLSRLDRIQSSDYRKMRAAIYAEHGEELPVPALTDSAP